MASIADLLAKTPLNEEQEKYVQIFQRAGDNLLNLINDILDLSKVEAEQLELERTGFTLVGHLEKVMEMVSARAQEKGLALIFDIAPNVPGDLIGDPTRLRQVLLNLIGNAIKFTASGSVSLSMSISTRHRHRRPCCALPSLTLASASSNTSSAKCSNASPRRTHR
ncbi:histidine kinase dimerization/phospho-acceptor domain-containing protein [Asticcacaulis sp.]|uniref:histidine kinase dimerization/phospho-acceptor domain-containing protein n=1 Tax=Asticcacaulis sp. TaxID=1872648 RepID=UPI002C41467F|nr:histidine kinase dimerization/phospho-acceptor domain-containing protein [Asticcacaulis sp.]HTM82779.1 histidine kinase dimerization/phospho-acceptor domain-containing protein [Asticcacaulis sp.]